MNDPSPTQEVERHWPNMLLVRTIGDNLPSSVHWVGAGSALRRLERHEVSEYMPVTQHEELIQAEVEKREEVEREDGTLLSELERLLPDWRIDSGTTPVAAIVKLCTERDLAESKLSSAVEELEGRGAELLRRAAEKNRELNAARKGQGNETVAYAEFNRLHGERIGAEEAAQLLRDKGGDGR